MLYTMITALVRVVIVDILVGMAIPEQAKDLYQDTVVLHLPIRSIILHNHHHIYHANRKIKSAIQQSV